MNDKNKKIAELEALLFVFGEPISFKDVALHLFISEQEARELINEYNLELQDEKRGLFLIFDQDKVQLSTKPIFANFISNLIKKELSENLTPASLETLAIVLYLGPISRSRIEYFRGVDSSFILRNLMMRGLIERVESKSPHYTYLYQPTFKLLRHLGLQKIEDLPDYDKFKSLNKQFEELNLKDNQNNG